MVGRQGCVCVCVCVCACMRARSVAQACLTLYDPMDCSLPGSSVQGIPRQEYRSGLLFPSPRDLLNPEIEFESPALQADSFAAEPLEGKPWEATLLLVEIFTTSPKPSLCK